MGECAGVLQWAEFAGWAVLASPPNISQQLRIANYQLQLMNLERAFISWSSTAIAILVRLEYRGECALFQEERLHWNWPWMRTSEVARGNATPMVYRLRVGCHQICKECNHAEENSLRHLKSTSTLTYPTSLGPCFLPSGSDKWIIRIRCFVMKDYLLHTN